MNKLKYVLSLFSGCLMFPFSSVGQEFRSDVYQFNLYQVNNAFAGSEGQRIFSFMELWRVDGKFLSGDGGPFVSIGYENDIKKYKTGIGFKGYAELFGPSSTTSLSLALNHRLSINEALTIIPALNVRRKYYSMDVSRYRPIQPNDPAVTPDHNYLFSYVQADASLLVKYKKAFLGGQMNNMVSSEKDNAPPIFSHSKEFNSLKVKTIIGGVTLPLHSTVEGRLTGLLYLYEGEHSYDLSAMFTYKKILHLSVAGSVIDDEFDPRLAAGVTIKDYFTLALHLYQKSYYNAPHENLSRIVSYMAFKF